MAKITTPNTERPAMPVIRVDALLDNADWTKGTWDLPIDNVADLRAYLKATKVSVAAFKALPVYRRNLRTQPWLAGL
jgi:hypothetical protein